MRVDFNMKCLEGLQICFSQHGIAGPECFSVHSKSGMW